MIFSNLPFLTYLVTRIGFDFPQNHLPKRTLIFGLPPSAFLQIEAGVSSPTCPWLRVWGKHPGWFFDIFCFSELPPQHVNVNDHEKCIWQTKQYYNQHMPSIVPPKWEHNPLHICQLLQVLDRSYHAVVVNNIFFVLAWMQAALAGVLDHVENVHLFLEHLPGFRLQRACLSLQFTLQTPSATFWMQRKLRKFDLKLHKSFCCWPHHLQMQPFSELSHKRPMDSPR